MATPTLMDSFLNQAKGMSSYLNKLTTVSLKGLEGRIAKLSGIKGGKEAFMSYLPTAVGKYSAQYFGSQKQTGAQEAFKEALLHAEGVGLRNQLFEAVGPPEKQEAPQKQIDPVEAIYNQIMAQNKRLHQEDVVNEAMGLPTTEGKKKAKQAGWDIVDLFVGGAKAAAGGDPTQLIMGVIQPFMDLIEKASPFVGVMETLGTIFEVYGAVLQTSMVPLIEKLFEVMMSDAVMSSIQLLADQLGVVVVQLLPLVEVIGPPLIILINMLVFGLQLLSMVIEPFAPTLLNIGETAGNFVTAMTPLIGTMTETGRVLMGIIGFIIEIGGGIFSSIINPISEFIKDISSGQDIASAFWYLAKDAAEGMVNGVIAVFNNVIWQINSLFKTTWPYINPVAFAKGGIITQPTVALMGEKGREAVIPLEDGNDYLGNRGGDTYILNGTPDYMLEEIRVQQWKNRAFRG